LWAFNGGQASLQLNGKAAPVEHLDWFKTPAVGPSVAPMFNSFHEAFAHLSPYWAAPSRGCAVFVDTEAHDVPDSRPSTINVEPTSWTLGTPSSPLLRAVTTVPDAENHNLELQCSDPLIINEALPSSAMVF